MALNVSVTSSSLASQPIHTWNKKQSSTCIKLNFPESLGLSELSHQTSKTVQQFLTARQTHFSIDSLSALKKVMQIMTSENNPEIKRSMTKSDGYVRRLFSSETWEGWRQSKTALGSLTSVISDYLDGIIDEETALQKCDRSTLLKANADAKKLLAALSQHRLALTSLSTERWSFSWFDKAKEMFLAVDEKISSWLSFLPVAAAEHDRCDLFPADASPGNAVMQCSGQECVALIQAWGQVVLSQNAAYRQTDTYKICQQAARVKELYKQYQEEYDMHWQAFQQAKKKYPDEQSYYVDKQTYASHAPDQATTFYQVGKECLQLEVAYKGYLNWEIYGDRPGPDSSLTYDHGNYNYDRVNKRPNVPVNTGNNNFCKP